MQFPLADKGCSVSLEQHQFRAPKSWSRWMQSAASLLTGSLPRSESTNNTRFVGQNQKKSFHEIGGYLGGEIYYVSPPLNNFSNGERIIALPTSIRKRANQIIESEEVLKKYAARAVELVCPIRPSRLEYLIPGTEKGLESLTADDFDTKEYHSSTDIADEKPTAIHERSQIRLLSVVSEVVRNYPTHKDAVIFFEEDGMVGLAPVGIRAGDIVCRIKESNAIGIMREYGDDVWMISRAMALSPLAGIDTSCPEAVFDMEAEDLEFLTRTSSCD